MARITFDALLHRDDTGSGICVRIPLDARAAFGRAQPAVRVAINGHPWRSTISVHGGANGPETRARRVAASIDRIRAGTAAR
jgi:hypothetical protein